jgi:hypothetical protein
MAGDRDQRQSARMAVLTSCPIARRGRLEREAELIRHVLHEARLAASGGPFQQHRESTGKGGPKDLHFVADWQIKRFTLDSIFLNWQLSMHPALRHSGSLDRAYHS